MTDDSMFDLTLRPLADGGFELEQLAGGLEEPELITLHAVQVRYLAERAGLLPVPDPRILDRMSARHIARLHALQERLGEIRRFYLDEIVDRCGSGIEFGLHLRALEDLTEEMLADVGTADDDSNAPGVSSALPCAVTSNEKSAAISVTPSKRGRPASGGALTNAERQAKHRARQADLLLTSKEPKIRMP